MQTGTLGITAFATGQLGDIIHVEMPATNAIYKKGDVMVGIESVKTAADVYSPVGGSVIECNTKLSSPEELSLSPEQTGWLVKMKVTDASNFDSMLDQAAYDKVVKEESV